MIICRTEWKNNTTSLRRRCLLLCASLAEECPLFIIKQPSTTSGINFLVLYMTHSVNEAAEKKNISS